MEKEFIPYLKEEDFKHEPIKKDRRVEVSLNRLDKDWFINMGIQYDKTYFCKPFRHVITIGLIFFSIYVRF